MSLKTCVVCIAGDIRQDIFAPATWEDADIERYFKQRGMALVWEDMNKSVTHLVISRAAFKSKHAAVKYVAKDRRGKKKAKVVTYDWLEDSFAAGKALQDVSVYDPGKPRDISAINSAYSKLSKTSKSKPEAEMVFTAKNAAPEKEGSSHIFEIRQQSQTQPDPSMTSTLNPENEEKLKTAASDKSSSSVVPQSSASRRKPIPAPSSKAQAQKDTVLEKPQVKANPAVASNVDAGQSLKARPRPLVFRDKTDQFVYRIKLTHKRQPKETWLLLLLRYPYVIDKAYLFRAYLFHAKKRILSEDSPPSTFQKAFELFRTSFSSKTTYPWDERLIRAGDAQMGKWRYELPAKGKPTGKVPPEFDPGHPKFIKPQDLAPSAQANTGRGAIETGVSEMPYERRPLSLDEDAIYDRLINNKACEPSAICAIARRGKQKKCYPSKARRSAAPCSLKRRAAESLGAERRSKVNKTGSSKFKSSEFVQDSDSDEDSPQPSQPQ